MDTSARNLAFALPTLFTFAALAARTPAAVIDLTTAGASGVINGAIYKQIDVQSSGTGNIDSFVEQSPQGNGTTSRAYNTTVNNIFDNKSPDNFNHSITLGEVPIALLSGTPYREFMLDINESSGNDDEFISLDEVQLFVGGTANSSVATLLAALLQHDGTLVYRMDAGGDNWVALDYSIGSGSGSGDMFLYVPQSVFVGFPGAAIVTLYSQFGLQGVDPVGFTGNFGGSDGFEEWALLDPVPEPTACLLAVAAALAATAARGRNGV